MTLPKLIPSVLSELQLLYSVKQKKLGFQRVHNHSIADMKFSRDKYLSANYILNLNP